LAMLNESERHEIWVAPYDMNTDPQKLSRKEMEERKKRYPWLWMPLGPLRCPGCGKEGREVGATFEPPAANDTEAGPRVDGELLQANSSSHVLPWRSMKISSQRANGG